MLDWQNTRTAGMVCPLQTQNWSLIGTNVRQKRAQPVLHHHFAAMSARNKESFCRFPARLAKEAWAILCGLWLRAEVRGGFCSAEGGGGELSSVKQLAYPLQGPPAPLRKAPQVRETPLCVRDTGLFDLLRTAVLTAVTVFLPRAKRSRCAGPACRCRDSPPRVLRREA